MAKVISAKVPDQDGIKLLLLKGVGDRPPRLSHLWVDAGYQGRRGKEWAEKVLSLSVEEVVHRTSEPTPEKVAIDVGAGVVERGLADRLAEAASTRGLCEVLPRRWVVVERTF